MVKYYILRFKCDPGRCCKNKNENAVYDMMSYGECSLFNNNSGAHVQNSIINITNANIGFEYSMTPCRVTKMQVFVQWCTYL